MSLTLTLTLNLTLTLTLTLTRCERGFATVTGPDIPNYVVEPTNEYFQRCLVSEGGWACEAKHVATRRLCPCAPARSLPTEGASSRLFSQPHRTESAVPKSKK